LKIDSINPIAITIVTIMTEGNSGVMGVEVGEGKGVELGICMFGSGA
jgi:hypothetical protein